MKAGCVIVGAGAGIRTGKRINKAFYEVDGRPLISYAVEVFRSVEGVEFIAVVVSARDVDAGLVSEESVREMGGDVMVYGGATRAESVRAGLSALTESCEAVLIHDAARPFVTAEEVMRVMEGVERYGAAVLSVPIYDTLKRADDGFIAKTVSRKGLYRALTPQGFSREVIERAYAQEFDPHSVTDDSELVEALGEAVALCEGRTTNIKVTTEEDLRLAELLLPVWRSK